MLRIKCLSSSLLRYLPVVCVSLRLLSYSVSVGESTFFKPYCNSISAYAWNKMLDDFLCARLKPMYTGSACVLQVPWRLFRGPLHSFPRPLTRDYLNEPFTITAHTLCLPFHGYMPLAQRYFTTNTTFQTKRLPLAMVVHFTLRRAFSFILIPCAISIRFLSSFHSHATETLRKPSSGLFRFYPYMWHITYFYRQLRGESGRIRELLQISRLIYTGGIILRCVQVRSAPPVSFKAVSFNEILNEPFDR